MIDELDSGTIVEINGARLWVQRTGQGPDLVLIHAGVADSSMWDPQVDALSSEFSVTRFDLRGFGKSDLPPLRYAHRDDVVALLTTLQIGSAVILGASYGGQIATQVALEYPDLVRGLILITSRIVQADVSEQLQTGWDRVEAAESAGDIALAVDIELQMWVDGPHRSTDEVDPAVRDQVRKMNGALFARQAEQELAPEIEFDPPVSKRLHELQIPVLAINGVLDYDDIRLSTETLVADLPTTRVANVDGAAHLPSLEQPDVVNRLILEFMREL